MESRLNQWIMEKRSEGAIINGLIVQRKAITIMNEINHPESLTFRASRGWLQNFFKRHQFVLRRITTSGRDLPENALNIIQDFFAECNISIRELKRRHNRNWRSMIFNMDETAIYLGAPSKFLFFKLKYFFRI